VLSKYFLRSLPVLVLKYTYRVSEGVRGVNVHPEELAALGPKVYLLSL
jgi:hypothetical protein